MTMKTAAWIAVFLVGVAFLYSFVYLSYTDTGTLVSVDPPGVVPLIVNQETDASKTSTMLAEFKAPATPDTAVDDLIDEALADRDDLDAEVQGELSDLETDTTNINNLNEVYDDQEIQ